MIYPATYNIVVLQDSTWKANLRLTGAAKDVEIDATNNLFTSVCHGLAADDPIIFAGKTVNGVTATPPCGLETNKPYYVIADGLTDDVFAISETAGGSSLTLHGAGEGYFTFARPLDLTGATVDADIKALGGGLLLKTFTCTVVTPLLGEVQILLPASTTASLDPGSYAYDLSVTTFGGEKYYWLTGLVEVRKTYSRT
jgi:hypothetical protein